MKIYCGHLQSSGLTWEQTIVLKIAEDYVIHSLNYNPRVLELFFKKIRPDTTPKCCWEELKKYLECPMDFWEDTFHGLSKEARILYIMMAVLPMPVELAVLEECYNNYIKRNREVYEWKNFSDTVIELERTILRTDLYNADGKGMIAVTFQNPSVKDFLIEFLRKNLVQYQDVLEGSCKYYAQYVEYLKILDKIDAPLEVYEKIFEKALEAIETDTIVFIERYESLLRHNKELDKYYANYETDLDYRDMGLGREFQIFLLYKAGCGNKIENIVKDAFSCIMWDICRYPESVLREDLIMLPDVIIAMWQNGICKEVLPALEICMNSWMQNRVSIYEMGLQQQIPQIWDEYVEKHKNEISKYLEKYYDAEICIAAVEKMRTNIPIS